jgi:hypothetical protein
VHFQPAYFVYLLRTYCLTPQYHIRPMRFLSLANTVIAVFLVSLGPFALMGQLPQLLSRLFPFTRGLNHAYWAPNAWALVTTADRALLKCMTAAPDTGAGLICHCYSRRNTRNRSGRGCPRSCVDLSGSCRRHCLRYSAQYKARPLLCDHNRIPDGQFTNLM